MAAGESADQAAQLFAALAEEHERAAAHARAASEGYHVAAATERRIARLLAPLAATGMHLLADRHWPGSSRAQVDLVAVGPQGVFVIDAKTWTDVTVVDGRLFRGQVDATDDLLALADLSDVMEHELARIGLAPGEVHVVAVLAGSSGVRARVRHVDVVSEDAVVRGIVAQGRRLTEPQVDRVLRRLLDLFPPMLADAVVADGLGVEAADADVVGAEAGDANLAPASAVGVDVAAAHDVQQWLDQAELAHAARGTLEEWMTFLHPTQAELVRRSFEGPARIRGAAGTGKTVVALHRAAYVARTRQVRVLMTGLTREVSLAWAPQLARLAPDVVDQVDFRSVHQFAAMVLRSRGVTLRLDKATVGRSFEAAWSTVDGRSVLRARGLGKSYWIDEIAHVIKGRGLQTFEEYAALPRAGRGHLLNINQRREMWALYEQYAVGLRRAKVHDWADVILLAEAELRARPWGTVDGDGPGDVRGPHGAVPDGAGVDGVGAYGAVVVDEAQDLSCAMVRMLHTLVGNAPDAFLLVGDEQQAVYPGVFALEEAGISVEARDAELTVNHRNTVQIAQFAAGLIAGLGMAGVVGADAGVAGGVDAGASGVAGRHGPVPEVGRHATREEHDRALVGRVLAVTSQPGVRLGDVAVLTEEYQVHVRMMRLLAAAGLPVRDLADSSGAGQSGDGAGRGVAAEAVNVGTIKRARGLEFTHVLLAGLRPGDVEPVEAVVGGVAGGAPEDGAARERWELERRERYVAMTRAREGLWLGVVG